MVGSLTGAVASQKVTEACEVGSERSESFVECNGISLLTARLTSRAESKDVIVIRWFWWKGHRSTDKRYAGDNRLIPSESISTRCLAPRCRLITSWGWSRSQGFGCSPIKVVRELVQNVVRQLVPICHGCRRIEEDLSLVREDRDEHTTGGPVVAPAAVR